MVQQQNVQFALILKQRKSVSIAAAEFAQSASGPLAAYVKNVQKKSRIFIFFFRISNQIFNKSNYIQIIFYILISYRFLHRI